MERKYFKPKSVTWWASIVPLCAGLFIASEPLHELSLYVEVLQEMTGDVSAAALINAGLFGIGLRGAVE